MNTGDRPTKYSILLIPRTAQSRSTSLQGGILDAQAIIQRTTRTLHHNHRPTVHLPDTQQSNITPLPIRPRNIRPRRVEAKADSSSSLIQKARNHKNNRRDRRRNIRGRKKTEKAKLEHSTTKGTTRPRLAPRVVHRQRTMELTTAGSKTHTHAIMTRPIATKNQDRTNRTRARPLTLTSPNHSRNHNHATQT